MEKANKRGRLKFIMSKPRIKIATVFYQKPPPKESLPRILRTTPREQEEPKYKPEHVYRMYEQIRRNTTKEFDFYCLTNTDKISHPNIKTIKLDDMYKGWFAKMRLFDPKIFASGRIFYIDLDMSILKNIDDILTFKGDLCMCKDAHYEGEYWSTIMLFDAPKFHFIYKNFMIQHDRSRYYLRTLDSGEEAAQFGDQNWINALCSTKTPVLPHTRRPSHRKTQKIKGFLPREAHPKKHLIVDLPSQWFPPAKKWINDHWELVNLDDLAPEAKILVYHGDPAPWEREKYK